MAEQITIKINGDTSQAEKSIEKLTKSQKDLTKATQESNDVSKAGMSQVDSLTGGAITKFNKFKTSLKGVTGGFNTLKGAIIATGLGALLIVVTSLIQAFKSSEEGQNKWAKAMGVVGSVVSNFTDLLADLGEKLIWVFENPKQAINDFAKLIKDNIITRFEGLTELIPKLGEAINLLFKGEFTQAGKVAADAVGKVTLGVESVTDSFNDAVESVKKFGKEIAADANAAAIIADKRAKADKLQRELLVEEAKSRSKIEELKLKAEQRDKYTAEQRAEFLKEALDGEDALASKKEEVAKLRYDAIALENTLSKSTKEAKEAEAQAEADLINISTERAKRKKELTTKQIAFTKEAIEDEKKAQLELNEFYKEQDELLAVSEEEKRQLAIEKEQTKYDEAIARATELGQATEELERAKEERIKQMKDEFAQKDKEREDAKLKVAKEKADKELEIEQLKEQAKGSIASQGLALAGKLAGEGTKLGKALGIAQTLYSTYEGVQSAFTTAQKSPYAILNPAYPFIQAGIAGAFGLANLTKLKSTPTSLSSASSGSGASPSVSGSAVASAVNSTPQINIVGQQTSNAILDGINKNTASPTKAYVVSSEVTTAQSLERNRIKSASL